MDAMSTFAKFMWGTFGVFTAVLVVQAVSHHREDIARWTNARMQPLKRGISFVQKYRQTKRAQKVASEI